MYTTSLSHVLGVYGDENGEAVVDLFEGHVYVDDAEYKGD